MNYSHHTIRLIAYNTLLTRFWRALNREHCIHPLVNIQLIVVGNNVISYLDRSNAALTKIVIFGSCYGKWRAHKSS